MYRKTRRGQTLTEWGVIIAVIAIAALVGLSLVSGSVGNVLGNIASSVGLVGAGNGGSGDSGGSTGGGGGALDANKVLSIPFGVPPTAPVAGSVLLYADYVPSDQTLIPTMISATLPSGTASDSSHYDNYSEAWVALGAAGPHGWLNNGSAPPAWVEYQFPGPTQVTSYSLRPWWADNYPGRTPQAWTFEGSTDGSTWQTLDTQTAWDPPNPTDYFAFTVNSPGAYTYYRMYITANHGDTYTGLGGLRMFGAGTTVGLFVMDSDGVVHQIH